MKILIVSSSDTDARWIRNILFEIGVDNVDACTNTSDAVDLLSFGGYNLVLSEVHLPVLTGFDLKKLMDSFGYEVPLAFFTEKLSESTLKEVKYAGVEEVFALDTLDHELSTLIERYSVNA